MLKIEQTQLKVTLYKDSVSDAGNGFSAMSMTRAKKEILGMSDEDIRNDLEQQRLEKAAAAEMEQTANIIKKTGIFNRVDKLYGEFSALTGGEPAAGAETTEGGETAGGFESELSGFGGGAETAPTETETTAAPTEESYNRKENLLLEEKNKKYEEKIKKYQNIYLKRLMESLERDENVFNLDSVEKDTEILNTKINEMTNEIDNLIK
jgi:hypothetical protein